MIEIYELLYKEPGQGERVVLLNGMSGLRYGLMCGATAMIVAVSVALGTGNKDQQIMHLSPCYQFAGPKP